MTYGDLTTPPSFDRRIRGYDPAAVDAWALATTVERAATNAAQRDAQARLAEHGGAQHALVRTLTSAHLMAERLVEETQEEAARRRTHAATEAELTLVAARRDAEELVASARDQVSRELAAFEAERAAVRHELDALRSLLHDERLRARHHLAAALAAVDGRLGDEVHEPSARERGTSARPLTVVAS
jgi:hypothetical protein